MEYGSLCIYLSANLSTNLSICQKLFYITDCLSIYLSIYLSTNHSICQQIFMYVYILPANCFFLLLSHFLLFPSIFQQAQLLSHIINLRLKCTFLHAYFCVDNCDIWYTYTHTYLPHTYILASEKLRINLLQFIRSLGA